MELLERYLHAIEFWLPKEQKRDIIAELSEDIHAQIEERESALGRALTGTELGAVLKARGRPMLVANAYLPQRYLIGPVLFPIYAFVLKIVGLCYLVPCVLVWIGLLLSPPFRATHIATSWVGSLESAWASLWTAALVALGVVTIIFAVLERTSAKNTLFEQWDPMRLPKVRDPNRIPRGSSSIELVVNMVMLSWWAANMTPLLVVNHPGAQVLLTPQWPTFHWSFLLLWLAFTALSAVNVIWPYWTARRAMVKLLIDSLGAVLFCWLMTCNIFSAVHIDGVTAARGMELVNGLNQWMTRCFPLAVIGGVIVAAFDVYRIMRVMKTKSGHLGTVAAMTAVMMILLVRSAGGQAPVTTAPPPPKEVAGIPANYDESLVGSYTLPDPLTSSKVWNDQRRSEILRLFEENQFGRSPGRASEMSFDVFDRGTPAFDGKAIRRQVTICFSSNKSGPKMELLVYVPAAATKPVPLLLNISFTANSNTVDDPGIKPGEVWGRDKKKIPAAQGMKFGRLDVPRLVQKGFGVATFYYGDVEPDFLGGIPFGVRALYLKPGQSEPGPGEWGSIAAWSWGLSRAMDYLETDKAIDAKRVGVMGVSRLGKTVLWAGAEDQRFALVIASCSGEGGAALSRRNYGETIAHLTAPARFPYQFAANYKLGAEHPEQRSIDAHMLIALMAPRPLLLQTGDTDFWSDPKGEFLAAVAAGPVYRQVGKDGLDISEWPPAGRPILHTLGYYMHSGGHGTIPSDWDVFLQFMDMHLHPGD